jgi:hypothetical protein
MGDPKEIFAVFQENPNGMVTSVSDSVGTIVLRLRIEHNRRRESARTRAYESIERNVLAQYGATRLPTGEHQLKLAYRTPQDLDDLIDDLLFEISGEAQMRDCYSETEARLVGSDRRW